MGRIDPIISGGGQERGLRSGTIAPPLVIGFGEAARLCKQEMEYDTKRIERLSVKLRDGLLSMEHTALNGDRDLHYPGCVNVSFAYVEGESLLMASRTLLFPPAPHVHPHLLSPVTSSGHWVPRMNQLTARFDSVSAGSRPKQRSITCSTL